MIAGITTTYHPNENFERANREYIECLQQCGFVVALLPPIDDDTYTSQVCRSIDALVLTGGEDIAFGNGRSRRDLFEERLARYAYDENLPTLGICRGMQMMNVALGGTLTPEVPASPIAHALGKPYDQVAHLVWLRGESTLRELFGFSTLVNSMHHQCIGAPAAALRVTALSPDAVIEGVEAAYGDFFVGVQWHPEYLAQQKCLFEALHRAAEARNRRECA